MRCEMLRLLRVFRGCPVIKHLFGIVHSRASTSCRLSNKKPITAALLSLFIITLQSSVLYAQPHQKVRVYKDRYILSPRDPHVALGALPAPAASIGGDQPFQV